MEEEVQSTEHRLGDEVKPAPVDHQVELLDPEVLLVAVDRVDLFGAGEQALGGRGRGARLDAARVPAHAGLVDLGRAVGALGEGAGIGHGLIGDRGRRPVLVGDADEAAGDVRPRLALGGGTAVGGFLREVVVGVFLQAVAAEHADHALVEHVVALGVRLTPARDEAVGIERDCVRALVLDLLADREHVFVVDGQDPLEQKPGAVVPGQGDRHVDRQGLAVGGPDGVVGRQRPGIGTDPAELGIVRCLGAGRREQDDLGALVVHGLVVVLQRDVVDAAALQRDRSGERRGLDLDARRPRQRLGATDRAGGRVGQGAGDGGGRAALLRPRRRHAVRAYAGALLRGLVLEVGLTLLLDARRGDEVVPPEQHDQRQGDGHEHVRLVIAHRGHRRTRSGLLRAHGRVPRRDRMFGASPPALCRGPSRRPASPIAARRRARSTREAWSHRAA